MEIKTIKAAVVGCGAISDIYMQNLTERFQVIKLVACTDLNEERMRPWRPHPEAWGSSRWR